MEASLQSPRRNRASDGAAAAGGGLTVRPPLQAPSKSPKTATRAVRVGGAPIRRRAVTLFVKLAYAIGCPTTALSDELRMRAVRSVAGQWQVLELDRPDDPVASSCSIRLCSRSIVVMLATAAATAMFSSASRGPRRQCWQPADTEPFQTLVTSNRTQWVQSTVHPRPATRCGSLQGKTRRARLGTR